MSRTAASDSLSCGTTQQTQASVTVTNKIKIFVSGLRVGDGEQELKKLFSDYGDVDEVVVDGTCATVTFQDVKMAKQMEDLHEILFGSRMLRVARVLEEQLTAPDYDAPFYQAGGLAAPMPYNPIQAPLPYQDMGLSSSYPSYQPAYPVWYPVTQYPPPSTYYDPAIADCGPLQPQLCPPATIAHFSVPPPITNTEVVSTAKSAFSFDMGTTKLAQPSNDPPTRPNLGCCHVCSAPSVQGVAPLTQHQQMSVPVQYHSQSYGHQLQPLTPITPSLHTGYMIPPTPTPTNLPPMTPTYFLPPSPAPYMMYHPHGHFQGGDNVSSSHPNVLHTSKPPPSSYTKIKPSELGSGPEEIPSDQKHNIPVAYFTSPFKRFTKFRGTPTPARFPLRSAPSQSYRGRGSWGLRGAEGGDNSSWYQQGARWGQKKGGELDKDQVKKGVGEGPDLLKDCNVDNAMEKCSLE